MKRIRFYNRISFQQALIAFVIGAVFAVTGSALEVSHKFLGEQERIASDIERNLRIEENEAARAAYDLDAGDAKQLLEKFISFPIVYKAELKDNYGSAIAAVSKERSAPDRSVWIRPAVIKKIRESYSIPLVYGKNRMAVGTLTLYPDLTAITSALFHELAAVFLNRFIAIVVVSLALLFGFYATITVSIVKMVTQISEIAPVKVKGLRIDIPSPHANDEIGLLGKTINGMLARIEVQTEELVRHRDHLEEMVKERTAELEAANKELDAFTYSVSHDLKAPLRALDGFSRILAEEQSGRLDADGRHAVDVISASAVRMAQLIDDLLAFSHLGRRAVEKVRTDMKALAVFVCDESMKGLPEGREVRIDIGELPEAPGDPAMMRQVFENLVSNAMKFTRPKKEPRVEIGSIAAKGENVYFVKDNGVGFDMRYVDRLFGVFQRLHGESEFEGTGVGLAIVQRVVQKHGGRVWAEGQVGEGAAFYFSLPNPSTFR